MKAIRIHEHGGPEVLRYEDVARPEPGPGEALVRVQAAGVNYIDTYHRRGAYEQRLPFTPGMEAGGVVDAVGDGVDSIASGDRVAYAMTIGAYAGYAVVPAWKLASVPDDVDIKIATAAFLQGLTAHYLVHDTYAVGEGDTVLIHAAAGGVGLLLVQMAKRRGARVIGTTSTNDKAKLAREYGADEVILYSETDFVEATKELTGGRGVDVIYDGVGRSTFLKGLDCLRPRGYMVLYGQASGAVDPIDPQILNQKGSIFLTRPTLSHYAAGQDEVRMRADDLFRWIQSDQLQVRIDSTFWLRDAAAAHRAIESGETKGKLLLMPDHRETTKRPAGSIDTGDELDEIGWESYPASDPPPY